MHSRDVSMITPEDDGHVVNLSGKILVSEWRCYLVPGSAIESMISVELGLVVECPGLAAELLESEFARITNGTPESAIVVSTIFGELVLGSDYAPAKGVLRNISQLVFDSRSGPIVVNIQNLMQVSDLCMKEVMSLEDRSDREFLLRKFQEQRRR